MTDFRLCSTCLPRSLKPVSYTHLDVYKRQDAPLPTPSMENMKVRSSIVGRYKRSELSNNPGEGTEPSTPSIVTTLLNTIPYTSHRQLLNLWERTSTSSMGAPQPTPSMEN